MARSLDIGLDVDGVYPKPGTDLDAVRVAYDTVAVDYAELLRDELASHAVDRSALAAFVGLVRDDRARRGGGTLAADGTDLVADLGCGPGRVAAHLDTLGLDVIGVDLSPAMVAEARRAHPGLRFEEGTLTDLDLADGSLAGAVAWYSIIHTPPDDRPLVAGELRRVLRPGGHLLVAFQVGDQRVHEQPVHLEHAYGHDLSLVVYRLLPDAVIDLLAAAGFELIAHTSREAVGREHQQQAFLLLRAAP